MTTKITLSLKGLEEFLEQIGKFGDATDDVIKEALEEGIKPMVEDMQSTSAWHDRTGTLRNSIEAGEVQKEGNFQYIEAGIDFKKHPEAFYGIFQEFGTSKMQAHPFIGPAYEKYKRKSFQIMKDFIKRRLGLK